MYEAKRLRPLLFILCVLVFFVPKLKAQITITNLNAAYEDVNTTADDYSINGSAFSGSSYPSGTTYQIEHATTTTTNNNLILSGFVNGGKTYNLVLQADTSLLQRNDNANVTGNRHIVLHERESLSGTTFKLTPSYSPSMEDALNSLIINRGADNVFANQGGTNINNIERIDLVWFQGIQSGTPVENGFIISERGGNDPFKIAAILSVDANGNPTQFGTILDVPASAWGSSSYNLVTTVLGKDPADANFRPSAGVSSQNISSVYIPLSDLGVAANAVIYGYALFPGDVDPNIHTLLDHTTYPTTTGANSGEGGLDLMASGGFFSSDGNWSTGCALSFRTTTGTRVAYFTEGDTICIQLEEESENTNPATPQSVSVVLTNQVNGDQETITLDETGNDTGIFTGCIPSYAYVGSSASDRVMWAEAGDTLGITFTNTNGLTCSAEATLVAPVKTKQLYLTDPSQGLDRVDPVATSDGTTASTNTLELNSVSDSVRDEFNSAAFNLNNGSANFSNSWQELGESDGPGSGRVRIRSYSGFGTNVLRIGGDEVNINGRGLSREANISGATTAILTFDYGTSGCTDGSGTVAIEVSADGGTNWNTLQSYNVRGGVSPTNQEFEITSYIASNTQIRFVGSGTTCGSSYIYFDNIQILYTTVSGTSTTDFTQSPAMCSDLILETGASVELDVYASLTSGTLSANPAITAYLLIGADTLISLENPTYNSANGLISWTSTMPELDTLKAGNQLILRIKINETGYGLQFQYDSQTKPSKISLNTRNVISIDTLAVYDAAYPGGNVIDTIRTGQQAYIRVFVSDPFGTNDITSLDHLYVYPNGSQSNSQLGETYVVATSGCQKIYELSTTIPNLSGTYLSYVTANEGYEGTVTDTYLTSLVAELDSDKDGIVDRLDLDDDNDGIPDIYEVCGPSATDYSCVSSGTDPMEDDDNDGVPNYQEASYCTLNAQGVCASMDADGDGIINSLDLDADNDGIPDIIEAGGVDANGDGVIDYPTPGDPTSMVDADNDGLADTYDNQDSGAGAGEVSSGTGIPYADTDGDGIVDALDLDADQDGIPDIIEAGGVDNDGNGRVDTYVDADGDGYADVYDPDDDGTSGIDTGEGSAPLLKTTDSGSDGLADAYTDGNGDNADADRDGYPDHLDLDADNDGIPDLTEADGADTNGDGKVDTATDADGDGLADVYDSNASDGPAGAGTNGSALVETHGTDTNANGRPDDAGFTYQHGTGEGLDTDKDGYPNWLDLDADNDGVPDLIESAGIDTNGDGRVDGVGNPGWDADGDGFADLYDTDDNNDNSLDATPNSMTVKDSDGNGSIDGADPQFDTDNDGIPNYLDVDADNDGILDIVESRATGLPDGSIDPDGDGQVGNYGAVLADADGDGFGDVFDPYLETTSTSSGITPPVVTGSDNNGDGSPESYGTGDNDGDAYLNHLDIDADDDGIVDIIEAQPSSTNIGADKVGDPVDGLIVPTGTDVDSDGLDDAFDKLDNRDGSAMNSGGESGLTPINSDGPSTSNGTDNGSDTIPDYLDTDSDNDGLPDQKEGHDANTDGVVDNAPTGVDTDFDGLDDGFDTQTNRGDANYATANMTASNQSVQDDNGDVDGSFGNAQDRDWRSGSNSTFPVEWVSFTARLRPGYGQLDWVTGRETNSAYFSVERSIDGGMFGEIGEVAAAGTSQTEQAYQFRDMELLNLSVPKAYYRLRQIDIDGKFEYSKTIELAVGEGIDAYHLIAYPNPVDQVLTISYSCPDKGNAELQIVSALGRLIRSFPANTNPGEHQLQVQVSQWAAGIYYCKIFGESGVAVYKFIVK